MKKQPQTFHSFMVWDRWPKYYFNKQEARAVFKKKLKELEAKGYELSFRERCMQEDVLYVHKETGDPIWLTFKDHNREDWDEKATKLNAQIQWVARDMEDALEKEKKELNNKEGK